MNQNLNNCIRRFPFLQRFFHHSFFVLIGLILLTGSALSTESTTSIGGAVQAESDSTFSFVYMTDVHIADQPHILQAYRKAVKHINALSPDFVLSGGDQVYDVMRGGETASASLFELFMKESKALQAPLYTSVGNHELFGIYKESPTDSTHHFYKYGMYQHYFGKTYYSFDYMGWHFIVLNNLDAGEHRYFANFDQEQLAWLEKDLQKVGTTKPIVLVMHIPIVSVQNQYQTKENQQNLGPQVGNQQKVMELIQSHNVKLVLQGHLHFWEDISILGKTRFITGPAIAGRPSWRGTVNGPRAFLRFQVHGENIEYSVIEYDQQ